MSPLTRFKFFLWYFSRFQVPLIGYTRPKLVKLNDQEIVVRLPLKRRNKNHLGSMYFGTLAVGADVAGGLHGFYHARLANLKLSLAFKSFQAQFYKRPESDVYFVSDNGDIIRAMIEESKKTGERINKMLVVKAFINYPQQPELVAGFELELSVKVLGVNLTK